MIGDKLTFDIMHGRENKMATVWLHGHSEECAYLSADYAKEHDGLIKDMEIRW